ncbi:MAG: cytochrome c oxidase subunit II [Sphingomonadales bacterium]
MKTILCGFLSAVGFYFASVTAHAAQPTDKALHFQEAATPIMAQITAFHTDILLPIIIAISIFVLALLIWVAVRYNRRANPEPSRTTHNIAIEVVWTLIPIGLLLVIAAPSFAIIDKEDNIPEAEVTVKAIGHQWYWEYEYPDYEGIVFDSIMIADEDLKPGQPRLLATDTHVVVPADTIVKMLITSVDVNHAWAIPAFGVKRDAIPGRINETWFKVDKPGLYYGQCSELCGIKHGFMPITVEVVSKADFETWIEDAKALYADASASAPDGIGR